MHLQNDISVTVHFFCKRSRQHCLGLPPHVAISLLLLEPCTSVCGNFDSGEGVKNFDLDRTSKEEEADAQDDILFVPRCR